MIIPEELKNKKQLLILIGVGALATLIFYINFLLVPQVSWVVRSIGKMTRTHSELKNAVSDISRIAKLESDMASYKEKVDQYEKMLPAEQEIPSLLGNLSNMAKSSNIKIVGITPIVGKEERGERNKIYKEIPILISAKSGYHELGRFLSNLENSNRFMKVADIMIKVNSTTPKKHDMELLVLTYILLKGR